MGDDQLTADNFIQAIKFMNTRDRGKILKERLIELILLKTDCVVNNSDQHAKLESRLTELELKYDILKNDTRTNTGVIEQVKTLIPTVFDSTSPNNQTEKIKAIEQQMCEMQKHLHSLEQYLRINNVEIVGLPDPTEDESHEEVLLATLNSLRDRYQ